MNTKANLTASNAKPGDWRAWLNMMPSTIPGSVHTLHVFGDIDVGNVDDGYTLAFESLEKSNPPTLVLTIGEVEILVPRAVGDTRVQLHYTQASEPGQIAGVIVMYPDGSRITIDTIGVAY